MNRCPLLVWNIVIRVLGFSIGFVHIAGYLGFAEYHSPLFGVPAISILLLSITPSDLIKKKPLLAYIMIVVVSFSYIWSGFFSSEGSYDEFVRLFALTEFLILLILLAPAYGGQREKN
jgi:hypothetical protein